jgi:hypothetical protein
MPIEYQQQGVKVKGNKAFLAGPSKVYNSFIVLNFIKVQSYKDLNSNKNKRL